MDNHELRQIVEKILDKEGIATLKELAEKAGVDRSNISTLINSKNTMPVSRVTVRKFKAKFPTYFEPTPETNTNQQHTRSAAPEPVDLNKVMIPLPMLLERMDKQIAYLERLAEGKLDEIAANLDKASHLVRRQNLQLEARSTVCLQSLARLEKKKEDVLIKAADSIHVDLAEQVLKQGSEVGGGRSGRA